MRKREMKTGRYQRVLFMVLCAVLLTMLLPVTASADAGPKPSVRVTFENLGNEPCYATLLSKDDENGPWMAWNGTEEDAVYEENLSEEYKMEYESSNAFAKYPDTDGYYYLQRSWCISKTGEVDWIYYPPDSFKILLYYPETDTFAVSGIYDRYAFDTYYTVDMAGIDPAALEYGEEVLTARRSYDYGGEIVGLLARILITIAIEMAIAAGFNFREKKQLRVLIVVNCVTQILLNVLLNVFNYTAGAWAFIAAYVLLETLVFLIEAVVYCIWLRKVSGFQRKKRVYVGYAWVSNTVSFIVGMIIARLLPGIF